MMKQTGPSPELNPDKLKVSAAEEGAETSNCIIILEGKIPTLIDIISLATHHEAHIDKSETGEDDQYTVKFPGREQETLTEEEISERLNKLSGQEK